MVDISGQDTSALLDGKYNVLEMIGQGGAGTVFKASDKEGNLYALKFLKSGSSEKSRLDKRFLREVEAAGRINHPNVVKIFEHSSGEGYSYIRMEYVKGGTLQELLNEKGSLSPALAIEIGKGILKGLSEVHKHNVVHRDIKPANILLRGETDAVLGDFGIARSMDMTRISRTGTLLGTPEYIAPEQWKGKESTNHTDIYSFGLLLYEMLCGTLPFSSVTDYEYMSKHLHEIPEFPEGTKIPEFLKRIIMRCLEKSPADRYESVDEIFVDLIRRKAEGRGFKLSAKPELWTWIKTAVPLFILLAGALYLSTFPSKEQKESVIIKVLPFYNRTGAPLTKYWPQAFQELLVNDLNRLPGIDAGIAIGGNRIIKKTGSVGVDALRSYFRTSTDTGYMVWGFIRLKDNRIGVELLIENISTGSIKSYSFEGATRAPLFSISDRMVGEVRRRIAEDSGEEGDFLPILWKPDSRHTPALLEYLVRGDRYFYRKDWQRALASYQKTLETDTAFIRGYIKVASCFRKLGKIRLAVEYLKRAEVLINGGKFSEKEKLLVAIEIAEVIDNDPLKSYKLARKLWRRAFRDSEAGLKYAYSCMKLGLYGEAVKVLKEIRKQAGKLINLKLVDCYIATHRIKMAKKVALTEWRKKQSVEWAEKLAIIAILEGKYREGLNYIDTVMAEQYENICGFYRLRGHLLLLSGDFNRAESSFMTALNRGNEEGSKAFGDLASIYLYKGKVRSAVRTLEDGVDMAGERGQEEIRSFYRCRVAELYALTERYSEAELICSEMLMESGVNGKYHIPDIWFIRGIAAAGSGRVDLLEEATIWLGEDSRKTGRIRSGVYYSVLKNRYLADQYYFGSRILDLKTVLGKLPGELPDSDYSGCRAILLNTIAEIYRERVNAFQKEKYVLERLKQLTFGRVNHGNLYALSYYYAGCTMHSLRNYRDAADNYKKFLELWELGDRDLFPEIFDAELRLKSIRNSVVEVTE